MKEKFEDRRLMGTININLPGLNKQWTTDKKTICDNIISIVNDYIKQGYRLTLRQTYYQLVSRELIPNHDTVYKKISSLLDDLRYSGRIDWNAIEDRGRLPYIKYYVSDIEGALEDTIRTYKLDLQKGQKKVVEVWSEKDAISGILKRVTNEYHVRLSINKGYSSSPAIYNAYSRFADRLNEGGVYIVVLYYGDHDSSGLDMVRDIEDRLKFFLYSGEQLNGDVIDIWAVDESTGEQNSEVDEYFDDYYYNAENSKYLSVDEEGMSYFDRKRAFIDHHVKIVHVGLTMEQIRLYSPPPNPAKISDPRAKAYIEKFGGVSWEVDALSPSVLTSILSDEIEKWIDMDEYEEMKEREREDIKKIKKIIGGLKKDDDEDENDNETTDFDFEDE